jgi:hypothetical protein
MTLTVKDVCKRYSVSEHTVLGWIHSGSLIGFSVSRKSGARKPRWRISEEALAAFEQLRTATPPPLKAKRRKRSGDTIEFYT